MAFSGYNNASIQITLDKGNLTYHSSAAACAVPKVSSVGSVYGKQWNLTADFRLIKNESAGKIGVVLGYRNFVTTTGSYHYAGNEPRNSVYFQAPSSYNGKCDKEKVQVISGKWETYVGNSWKDIDTYNTLGKTSSIFWWKPSSDSDKLTLTCYHETFHGCFLATITVKASGILPSTCYYTAPATPTSLTFNKTKVKPGGKITLTASGPIGNNDPGVAGLFFSFNNSKVTNPSTLTGVVDDTKNKKRSITKEITVPTSAAGKTINTAYCCWVTKKNSQANSKNYQTSSSFKVTNVLPSFKLYVNDVEITSGIDPDLLPEGGGNAKVKIVWTHTEDTQIVTYKFKEDTEWQTFPSEYLEVNPASGPTNAKTLYVRIEDPTVDDEGDYQSVTITRDWGLHVVDDSGHDERCETCDYFKNYISENRKEWMTTQTSIKISGTPDDVDTKTIDATGLFQNWTALESLDISGWNMINVVSMESFAAGCVKLKGSSVEETSGDTTVTVIKMVVPMMAAAKNVDNMFKDCSSIVRIEFQGFGAASDISKMLFGCTGITDITFNFNTGADATAVKTIKNLVRDCTKLVNFYSEKGFYSVRDYSGMFKNKTNLTTVKLNGIHNAKNLCELFSGCTKLTSITMDESSEYYNYAINLDYMYKGCCSLSSITLPNNMGSVVSTRGLFQGCTKLTKITFNSLNFKNVYNFQDMFNGCEIYSSFDADEIDAQNAIFVSSMFAGMKTITTLNLKTFKTPQILQCKEMFKGDINLIDITFCPSMNPRRIKKMSGMFSGCYKLREVNNFSTFGTSKVDSLEELFKDCYDIEEIDTSNFNILNATSLSKAFQNCYSLKKIDVRNFFDGETSSTLRKLTDTSYMFENCWSLKYIFANDGDDWASDGQVTSSTDMFKNCYLLNRYNSANLNNITNANTSTGYFSSVLNIIITSTLDAYSCAIEDFVVQKDGDHNHLISCPAQDQYSIIIDCTFSDGNTDRIVYSTGTTIYEKGTDLSIRLNETDCKFELIKYAPNSFDGVLLTQLDFKDTNGVDVKKIGSDMIVDFEVELIGKGAPYESSFSKYADIAEGFEGQDAILTIKVSGESTEEEDSLEGAFSGYSKLKLIDLSSADLTCIKNYDSAFANCPYLAEIVFPENLGSNASYNKTFYGCSSLEEIVFPYIDTYLTTDLADMFYGCTSLKSLDLTGFTFGKTSSIDFSRMFYNCTSLTQIIGTDWRANYDDDEDSVISDTDMFFNCPNLAGVIAYDEEKIDSYYANPTTGYFTAPEGLKIKVNQRNVYHVRIWTKTKNTSGLTNKGLIYHANVWKTPGSHTAMTTAYYYGNPEYKKTYTYYDLYYDSKDRKQYKEVTFTKLIEGTTYYLKNTNILPGSVEEWRESLMTDENQNFTITQTLYIDGSDWTLVNYQ